MQVDKLIDLYGHSFAIGHWDALTQFNVSRRLSPVIANILPLIPVFAANEDVGMEALALLATSRMTDDEAAYLLNIALDQVKRKDPGTQVWHPIRSGGTIMYQDLKLKMLLRLAVEVVRENLSDFFTLEALMALNGEAAK